MILSATAISENGIVKIREYYEDKKVLRIIKDGKVIFSSWNPRTKKA